MITLLQSGMSRGDETFGSGGSFFLAIILFIIVVLWQILKFISWLAGSQEKPAAVKNKIIFSESQKNAFNDKLAKDWAEIRKREEENSLCEKIIEDFRIKQENELKRKKLKDEKLLRSKKTL